MSAIVRKRNKIVFSLIMCVIVTLFNLRLYYKELGRKQNDNNGNRDAKEKEQKRRKNEYIYRIYK